MPSSLDPPSVPSSVLPCSPHPCPLFRTALVCSPVPPSSSRPCCCLVHATISSVPLPPSLLCRRHPLFCAAVLSSTPPSSSLPRHRRPLFRAAVFLSSTPPLSSLPRRPRPLVRAEGSIVYLECGLELGQGACANSCIVRHKQNKNAKFNI